MDLGLFSARWDEEGNIHQRSVFLPGIQEVTELARLVYLQGFSQKVSGRLD